MILIMNNLLAIIKKLNVIKVLLLKMFESV